MKVYIRYFVIIAFTTWGCKEIIEVDVPYNGSSMVVQGFLQPDSTIHLLLKEDRHILMGFAPFDIVSSAIVELFEDQVSKGFFHHDHSGWYSMDSKPESGKTYSIKIHSEEFGSLEAETTLPHKIDIGKVRLFDRLVQKDTSKCFVLEIDINDPANEENFYEIALFANKNDKFYKDDILIHEHSLHAPVFLDVSGIKKAEQYLSVSMPSLMFSDVNINGTVKVYIPIWQIKDLNRGESKLAVGPDNYKLVKNDSLFLFLNHVDRNYYYYRKTLDLQTINKGNPLAEPITVYSNVNNGLGIFAGFHVSRHIIDINNIPKILEKR